MLVRLAALLIPAAVVGCAGMQTAGPTTPEEAIPRSKFAFVGTVQQVGATTMPTVQASDRTVIVHVDETLDKPASLDDFTGREVTAVFGAAPGVKAGDQSVFFTNGAVYGSGLAVRVEGTTGATQLPELRARIKQVRQQEEDKALRERLEGATLVIEGRVVAVKPAGERPSGRRSEHEALWHTADIRVEAVLRGRAEGETVPVQFPSSMDEVWYDAPKFKVGQEGVWILRKDALQKGFLWDRPTGYTALDKRDVLPATERQHVADLLRGTR